MRIPSFILLVVLATGRLVSQVNAPPRVEATPALEDNSFFIEEAYNQEEGVVQHISGFLYTTTPKRQLAYSFTQEWPLAGELHQISYTLPLMLTAADHQTGVGDIFLNYRYQLTDHQNWAAISPRLSFLLPTGSASRGLGSGVLGVQLNLPASKRLSDPLVAHANLGVTYLPHLSTELGSGKTVKHSLTTFNAGGSIIWLAAETFNVMLEYTTNHSVDRFDNGAVEESNQTILCPGVRFAINAGNLQIVPGIGFPLFLTRDDSSMGAFLYLSFEHPF